MHNKEFILHLTLIENIGPAVIQKIIRSDILVSDLYSFSQSNWMHTFGFSEGASQKLVDGLANTKILETELALIQEHNIEWITFAEETYPHMLKNIYLPPAVLYIQGSSKLIYSTQFEHSRARPEPVEGYPRALKDTLQQVQGERTRDKQSNYKESLSPKLLAVVGARKADDYGQRVVDALIPDLVAAKYVVVSGGALGIDAMAHASTLKSGGKTIAVLGSGLLQWYPTSNQKLFASIIANGGTLVSSFPLRMQALPGNFPARNRIVTGLSRGCVVIQAAQKSGALISADYAMEQGREVFAVPGPIGNELSAGCNALIQKGAKLVACAADILEEFGDRVILPDKQVMQEKAMQLTLESASIIPVKKTEKPVVDKYACYSEQQKLIITACKQLISFDDIIIKTKLDSVILQSELFNLQLDGIVSQDFTGMWVVQ